MRRAISTSAGLVLCCSGSPWSWSSTKRLSFPKMSCRRAASASALIRSSANSAWSTTPPRHPVVAIRPRAVAFQQLPVEPGLVVVALEVGGRGQLEEVLVPLGGLGQQGEVVVELLPSGDVPAGVVDLSLADRALVPRLGGHVGLGADDRVDPRLAAGGIEVEDAVHVPVIGDPERRLTVGCRRLDQVRDPGGAVQHREFGVGVQVCERPCGDQRLVPSSAISSHGAPVLHRVWTSYTAVIPTIARWDGARGSCRSGQVGGPAVQR